MSSSGKDGQIISDKSAAEGYEYGKQPDETKAKTENPKYGVGGTAKDGGVSTAATVEDGGPNDPEPDGEYKPS